MPTHYSNPYSGQQDAILQRRQELEQEQSKLLEELSSDPTLSPQDAALRLFASSLPMLIGGAIGGGRGAGIGAGAGAGMLDRFTQLDDISAQRAREQGQVKFKTLGEQMKALDQQLQEGRKFEGDLYKQDRKFDFDVGMQDRDFGFRADMQDRKFGFDASQKAADRASRIEAAQIRGAGNREPISPVMANVLSEHLANIFPGVREQDPEEFDRQISGLTRADFQAIMSTARDANISARQQTRIEATGERDERLQAQRSEILQQREAARKQYYQMTSSPVQAEKLAKAVTGEWKARDDLQQRVAEMKRIEGLLQASGHSDIGFANIQNMLPGIFGKQQRLTVDMVERAIPETLKGEATKVVNYLTTSTYTPLTSRQKAAVEELLKTQRQLLAREMRDSVASVYQRSKLVAPSLKEEERIQTLGSLWNSYANDFGLTPLGVPARPQAKDFAVDTPEGLEAFHNAMRRYVAQEEAQ